VTVKRCAPLATLTVCGDAHDARMTVSSVQFVVVTDPVVVHVNVAL
jgi:hypothetical protein